MRLGEREAFNIKAGYLQLNAMYEQLMLMKSSCQDEIDPDFYVFRDLSV